MRGINDFFEDEGGLACEFGANLPVCPIEDAKRIAVDYAEQFKPKWIPWEGQSEEQKSNFDKLDTERILLKFDDGTVCSFNSVHPFACVTDYLVIPL